MLTSIRGEGGHPLCSSTPRLIWPSRQQRLGKRASATPLPLGIVSEPSSSFGQIRSLFGTRSGCPSGVIMSISGRLAALDGAPAILIPQETLHCVAVSAAPLLEEDVQCEKL